jgi:TonB-linked SusC/RagA family outer membrane protein
MKKRFIFIVVFLSMLGMIYSQTTGKVTDERGQALPGVTVIVKGSSNGTISDSNGNYTLQNVSPKQTLEFTFIGMQTQTVNVGNRTVVDVTLRESLIELKEVVAVGYGTQKKVNLTGSVQNVSSSQLDSRPITQASQALAGLVSGVSVIQNNGRPGSDVSSISIRGLGTFSSAGNSPLVLVDGLASSMDAVAPENIKNITVLKDAASCAIYGTRAANGVILIETKRGKQSKFEVNYSNYFGVQKVTELPNFLNASQYATYKNLANANDGKAAAYTADQIAAFTSGSDPNNYPDVAHLKNLLNSGSGFQTNHNLNFMGGDARNSFLFSLGYLEQNGLVAKDKYSKYNFLLNFDSKIKDNLKLKVDLTGNSATLREPRCSDGDITVMFNNAVRMPPVLAGKKSDGTYGYQDNYSPEGWMDSPSFIQTNSKYVLGGAELSWEIIKGLTLSGKAGYNYSDYTTVNYLSTLVYDATKTLSPNNLTETMGNSSLLTLQSLITYEKKIKEHSFTVLAGFSEESYRNDWLTGYRDKFPNDLLYQLNAAAATNMQSSGSGSEWALQSYFGRLNYSFMDRYLFEANVRYDGTSRFPEKNRWGIFPSFSAGWRVSEESFIKDNIKWIDNLKVRLSSGTLGNQNIGNYPYQSNLTSGQNYPFGGALNAGARVTTMANSDITWESTTINDLGLDLTVLNGKLSFVFDYFDKTTSGILYNVAASAVLGLNPSTSNAGTVNNKGVEFLVNYQTSIGDLKINIVPNFSFTKNQVISLGGGKLIDINSNLFVGQPIGAIYGYVSDGLFVDANDVTTYPKQPYLASPGSIRYKDISGPNGTPDGVVDANDRKVIGSTTPQFAYGATLAFNFKGFDLSAIIQGLGGFQKAMGYQEAFAFFNSGQIQQWQVDNMWTSDNPNRWAKYPKLGNTNLGQGNILPSTYWLRDASFIRLKNLQLGYSLPKSILEKLKISNLRIYVSGQNLFSMNSFYQGWDPEMYQNNYDNTPFYPISGVYTAGLSVKF